MVKNTKGRARETVQSLYPLFLSVLSVEGSLGYREIAGNVRFQYRKAEAADPEPRIVRGLARDGALLKRLGEP